MSRVPTMLKSDRLVFEWLPGLDNEKLLDPFWDQWNASKSFLNNQLSMTRKWVTITDLRPSHDTVRKRHRTPTVTRQQGYNHAII